MYEWLECLEIAYQKYICFKDIRMFFDEYRFRLKYHPEDSVKRKEEQLNFLKVSQVFGKFLYNSLFFKETRGGLCGFIK